MPEQDKKLKITIGIPALNEQANIQNLLLNLLAQKQTTFDLQEIIVLSDGSNDKTVQKAQELNNPLVQVIDNKDRQGKIKRLNELFMRAKGDIVVIIDADVLPTTKMTLEKLIQPFIDDQKVAYVSGKIIPLKPTNFIQQAVIVSRNVWDKVRLVLKEGKSIYTCHGALYALKTDFAKTNPFPEKIWADIGFHYIVCLQKKLKYQPAKEASVYVKQPSTVKDYLTQISRYQREDKALIDYFGESILPEYVIPEELLTRYKLEAFIQYPLHSLAIFALNFYAKHLSNLGRNTATANWVMVNSTKEEIVHAK